MSYPRNRGQPCDPDPSGECGFTLIEILIVLVILALVAGLVVTRGPMRSATLDLRSSASDIMVALRGARSRAIVSDQSVGVTLNAAARSLQVDGAPPRRLQAGVDMRIVSAEHELTRGPLTRIVFSPDGSSTGVEIVLSDAGRRLAVGVSWLTGRVHIDQD